MTSPALTRLEREKSKQQWDNLHGVVTKEFNQLEGWVKNNTKKHMDELTKLLREDLSETEVRWACEEQIDILSNLKEAWQKKLDYIKSVLITMETKVLGAPMAESKKEEGTSKHRQFALSSGWNY